MAIIGNAMSVLALKAKIYVTTMPWAWVNFIYGGVTQVTIQANGSGNCEHEILVPQFGSWTIYATGEGGSGTSYVGVYDTVTYTTTVTLTRYFIQNGNYVSGVWGNKAGSDTVSIKDAGDFILLQSYQGGGNEIGSGYLNPAVSMNNWKTLYIDSQEIGDEAYAGVATNNSSNPPNFSAVVQLCGRREEWDGRHTTAISVSGVSGSQYLALRTKSWINTSVIPVHGAGGNIRVWNMWLST